MLFSFLSRSKTLSFPSLYTARLSPPDFNPSFHLVEERFPPALQAFCLRSPRASFAVFILVSLRQSSLQTKTAWSRPSNGAARLLLSAFECGFPRISRRPVSPEKPFLRFPSALCAVCFRSAPSLHLARLPRLAFSLSARFSVFQTQALPFLFRPTFSVCLLVCFPPLSGVFPPLSPFSMHKKRTGTWPAPIFIYIKNFPMYP